MSNFIAILALLVSIISLYFSYTAYKAEREAKRIESRLFVAVTSEIGLLTLTEDELISKVKSKYIGTKESDLQNEYLIKKAIYDLLQKQILVLTYQDGDEIAKIQLSTSGRR